MAAPNPGNSKIVGEFLKVCQVENKSDHTLRSYGKTLELFLAYLKETLQDKSVLTVTTEDIRGFVRNQVKTGLQASSVNLRIATIKTFFQFLVWTEHISKNPTVFIRYLKAKSPLPQVLSEAQIRELLEGQWGKIQSPRDRAILELASGEGLRVSELSYLNVEDISFDRQEIRIRKGKGLKERILPLTQPILTALQTYCEKHNLTSGALLCYSLQKGSDRKRLQIRSLRSIISRYLSLIPGCHNTNPHVLRHSLATHLHNRGADIRAIQEILGHESITTTEIYTHLETKKLCMVYHQCFPRSQVNQPPERLLPSGYPQPRRLSPLRLAPPPWG